MKHIRLVDLKINSLLFYFTVYSFIGWFLETVYNSVKLGRFAHRGFLFGPFCPIYGFGAIILIIFLKPVKDNLLLFLAGSILLTSLLEYVASFALEAVFNRVWWDYSSEPFNIHGRVSLKFSLYWGIAAYIFLKFVHPYIQSMLSHVPIHYVPAMTLIFLLYFAADTALVTVIMPDLNWSEDQLAEVSISELNESNIIEDVLNIDTDNPGSFYLKIKTKYKFILGEIIMHHTAPVIYPIPYIGIRTVLPQ